MEEENPEKDFMSEISILEKQLSERLTAEKPEILIRIADLYYEELQDWAVAKDYYTEVVEISDNPFIAKAYHKIGNILFHQEEWTEALENYQLSLEQAEKTGQIAETGSNYNRIAVVYTNLQKNKEAIIHFEKAIEWCTKHANLEELGRTFYNLRLFLKTAMSIQNTLRYYESLLLKAEEKQSSGLKAFVHQNMGLWYQAEQESKKACEHFEFALKYKLENQITFELGNAYYWLASVEEELGKHREALENQVLALRAMLVHKEYAHIEMVLYYLEYSLADCNDADLKNEAENLILEAKKLPFLSDEEEEDNKEETPDENLRIGGDMLGMEKILTETSFADAVAEVAAMKKAGNKDILQNLYQSQKEKLPDSLDEFMETALLMLNQLKDEHQKSWFSKKKKKEAFEMEKSQILSILDNLKQSENLETNKSKIENCKKKIDDICM